MFLNILFPEELCLMYQSRSADQFNTTVMGDDVNEDRNQRWTQSRRTFEPITGIFGRDQLRLMRNIFQNVKGRTYSFRFKDPTDCAAESALVENLAGGTTFQLRQEYSADLFDWAGADVGNVSTYRSVSLVDPSSCFVTVNGAPVIVTQNPYTSYLFNEPAWNENGSLSVSVAEDGGLTFSASLTATDEIRATFVFHHRVRFNVDNLDVTYVNYESFQVNAPLIEVGVEEAVS